MAALSQDTLVNSSPLSAGCTERVARLRSIIISTAPSLCVERALLITDAYAQHIAEPVVLKRAHSLAHILDNMSIYIAEDEWIVGNHSSAPRAAPLFPEYCVDFLAAEIDQFAQRPADQFQVSAPVKQAILEKIVPAWQGRTLLDRAMAIMPEDVATAQKIGAISGRGNLTSGDGHIILDIEMVLNLGLRGVIKEARGALAELPPYEAESIRKRPFLQAVIVSHEAAVRFAQRFAVEAEKQAADPAKSPERRSELIQIAEICRHVPEYPAHNFREAVQSAYFIHLISQIESNGHSFSLGRLDQYLFPFYQADIASGALTRLQAQELLELLWLKLFSVIKVRPWDHTRFGIGYPTYQNVTIGGQTIDGQDAVNELSYLVLETIRDIRLTQPNVSARVFNGTSNRFLLECARTIKLGFGMPALQNDEIIIPALLEKGVQPDDAANYAMVGCMEVGIPGKWGYRVTGMTFLNILKTLELTLHAGRDPQTGITLLPATKDLARMDSFDDLYNLFLDQYRFYARMSFQLDSVADLAIEEMTPDAFTSGLIDNCIARGLNAKAGGAKYDIISGPQSGIVNTANALMALKKVVFEDQRQSTIEILQALDANFEIPGGEVIRQRLLGAPKFGNDYDEVDSLAVRISRDYLREAEHFHNLRYGKGPIGGIYAGSTGNISANVPLGTRVGATPDGRRSFEPIAEGVSPVHGTDVSGPTCILRSVSKLPTLRSICQLLNLRLSPNSLADDAGLERLVLLIRGFIALKIWHVQFNTVSTDTLVKAQQHPEEYLDLVVRVAGYSALFVTLDRATQDDIINRTMLELG